MQKQRLKIGLFGIGHATYWPQFDGLEQRLIGYIDQVQQQLSRPEVEVVNLGMIDNPDKALVAGHAFRQADVDLIFLYATTYALSSTVLPVVQRAGAPVVILNLQPEAALDYDRLNRMDRRQMTGEWLAYCGACPVPELANVFKRAGLPFHQITGVLNGDPQVWLEVDAWLAAAGVAHCMAHNRLGLMGRYYNGMLDIYSDLTLQCTTFGGHIEMLEIDQLAALRRQVTAADVQQRLTLFAEEFEIQHDCDPLELARAARTSVALERLVEQHQLGSMAYYYESLPGHEHEDVITSMILGASLLTSGGVAIAGEYEVKNVQAMKIMDAFGAGGSFTEFFAIDFKDDVVLMGHDGPGHSRIAEGKTKVRPLQVYHGKVGAGLSVEMQLRYGPVTLLSVLEQSGGKLMLLCAQAEAVPGPTLAIGNTNTRYRFACGARRFVEDWNAQGPAHHCAIGVGHLADRIKKLGALLGMETVQVV
ncbi:hypothetical protein [Collimonas sp.]|jgi:L-arabinose isomerase|uniref:hypothetical protein n=1 Tax=Collimonas sp. TaxID=1963772 RepID=UPI002C2A8DA6|nr:hypothetical protein [Collimonas sp.]HWW05758.1 hypothetical protein [Collimonas sp.]